MVEKAFVKIEESLKCNFALQKEATFITAPY